MPPFFLPKIDSKMHHFFDRFLHGFLDPLKTSKSEPKERGRPLATMHAPPSLDSSPLVNPLRVLLATHRTHWARQSFPEQQISILSQQQTVSTAVICPDSAEGGVRLNMIVGGTKLIPTPFFNLNNMRQMGHTRRSRRRVQSHGNVTKESTEPRKCNLDLVR